MDKTNETTTMTFSFFLLNFPLLSNLFFFLIVLVLHDLTLISYLLLP